MPSLPSAKSLAFEMREKTVQAGSGRAIIPFLVCLPLEEAGFVNAFSTRMGGVSALPKESLHLAFKTDADGNVSENRRRFLHAIGAPGSQIVTPEQTHSAHISVIEPIVLPILKKEEKKELSGDALITSLRNVLAGVKTADCLPVLVGDPETGALAAIHAGWKGTLERITEKTIALMQESFNTDPTNCVAALGPAACAECYAVGTDVAKPFEKEFPYATDLFTPAAGGNSLFDIRLANAMQLISAGVAPFNIFGSDECNMHQNELFFSHRREGKTENSRVGRCLSVIGRK